MDFGAGGQEKTPLDDLLRTVHQTSRYHPHDSSKEDLTARHKLKLSKSGREIKPATQRCSQSQAS